jgi:flagellar hook protein FlgE
MLESIYVGMTGLLGYSRGLRVIANNTANINTPGFKGSSLQFSDLFYSNGNLAGGLGGQNSGALGYGLNTGSTTLSFRQGELRQTGNALDMAIDGQGLFTLRDANGHITYTRAGQFQFNNDGVLVNQSDDAKVMGRDANGNLVEISVSGLRTNAGKPTAGIKFNGNLSSTATEQTIGGVKVIDAVGGEHTLSIKMTSTAATAAGSWKVELFDGTTAIGTGSIVFQDGKPTVASAKVNITYTPTGLAAQPLTLDFSTDVTSFASGNLSTLATSSQDGFGPGGLTNASFDAAGVLVLTYSNGQTVKGTRLSLGRFDSTDAVGSVGDNQFEALDSRSWSNGTAGDGGFGAVRSGLVEISNVDLSQQFSDLVVMQRGYQASSQIISTANDMLQELFSMRGK